MNEFKADTEFTFSQFIQDSLLLLGIYDDEVMRYIFLFVKPDNFNSEHSRFVCFQLVKFYKEFNSAPGDYFWDIVKKELERKRLSDDKRKLYSKYFRKLIDIQNPNKDYVLKNLNLFIKHQAFTSGIIKGASLVQSGKYEQAEKEVIEAFKTGIHSVDSGIDYTNYTFIAAVPELVCKTLIEPMDKILGGFRRKELWLWLASTNVGKTWALIYSTSVALLQGKNVIYYTLGDLDREWIALRLDMMLNALGTKVKEIELPHKQKIISVKTVFDNKKKVLKKRKYIGSLGGRLFIKNSPSGGLTVSKLRADLEMMEVSKGYFPDKVIIDYADLMVPEKNYSERRHEYSKIYEDIKQLSMDMNIHVQSASQSNRASIDIKMVSLKHFAEDIGKARPANVIISLCQTPEEERKSIMRFFCCKNSNEKKGWQIISRYCYDIGQFCLGAELLKVDCDEDT